MRKRYFKQSSKMFIILSFIILGTISEIREVKAAKIKDEDILKREKGFFGELGYNSISFGETNLFPEREGEKDEPERKSFFQGSLLLNLGYQQDNLKTYLIIGIPGYQYGSEEYNNLLKGSGFSFGIHAKYKEFPSIEYVMYSGKISTEEPTQPFDLILKDSPIGTRKLSFKICPKVFSLNWPERDWLSTISLFPGIGYEFFWIKAGHYWSLNQDTDLWELKENKWSKSAPVFKLSFEIGVYQDAILFGGVEYNFGKIIETGIGVKYLFYRL